VFPSIVNKFKKQIAKMSVKVLVPTTLQTLTDNQATVECTADSISALIDELEVKYPGMKTKLCDDTGKPRRFLNLYVNEEDIRFLDGSKTALQDGDKVSIVPAVAGG
jgi:molybdopterin converting factor small subunit